MWKFLVTVVAVGSDGGDAAASFWTDSCRSYTQLHSCRSYQSKHTPPIHFECICAAAGGDGGHAAAVILKGDAAGADPTGFLCNHIYSHVKAFCDCHRSRR